MSHRSFKSMSSWVYPFNHIRLLKLYIFTNKFKPNPSFCIQVWPINLFLNRCVLILLILILFDLSSQMPWVVFILDWGNLVLTPSFHGKGKGARIKSELLTQTKMHSFFKKECLVKGFGPINQDSFLVNLIQYF